MMRPLLASLLGLALLCLSSSAAAQLPSPPSSTVLSIGPELDTAELVRGDLWIERMTETRRRRQALERWGVPFLLGTATVVGAASALLPDLSTEARLTFAGSAVLAAGAFVPSLFGPDERRARWFAGGGAAFAVAYGAAGIIEAQKKSCSGWCGNERALGWLSGALVSEGLLLLPLALVERGPRLSELESYAALPAKERLVRSKKLLARIDRAERKAIAISLTMGLVSTAVFAAGAAAVQDREQQVPLLALGGASLAISTVTALAALLRPSRLERMAQGRDPMARERVLW